MEIVEQSDSVVNLERLVKNDASERQQMDLVEMVRKTATTLEDEYHEATIEVSHDYEKTYVSADEGFRLALEHAIANVIEHNDIDDSRVTLSQDVISHDVVIRVDLNGPGLPEMEINALENEATPIQHGRG